MFIDTLASAPDMMHHASGTVSYLAQQSGDNVQIGGGDGNFKGLNVTFSPGVEKIIRVIAIALGVAWALFLIWNLGKPGGSRQAIQRMGGIVGIIAALTAVVGGLNINATMKFINGALKIGWAILQTFTNAFK